MLTNSDYVVAVLFYGLFRNPNPSQNLVDKVIKNMEQQNIDISQVVRAPANHCVDLPPPTAGESSAYRHWPGKWIATFSGFKLSGQLNIFLVCNLLCQN
jgi:hypothetical protein